MNVTRATPKVLILGGGFGGMEVATYLRWKLDQRSDGHAGPAADITMVSDDPSFLFRPNTIYIPFGLKEEKLRFPLEPALSKKGIAFLHGSAREIDPAARTVTVDAGGAAQDLSYDYLVVATGANVAPEEVEGMAEHAHTPWTPEAMRRLGEGFESLVERGKAGERTRALFLVPPNNKCSGPLYELVFMFDSWLRRKEARDWVTLSYTTFEKGFIAAFGPKVNEYVEPEFMRRGIDAHREWVVDRIEEGVVRYQNGEAKEYDLLVTFPPYVANARFEGLPMDDRGFIRTAELGSRRVDGHPEVFVPGDAGDFPIKQAFLAFLEADGVAEALAGELTGQAPDHGFDPISMCVMEQYDKALFAQVPLELTGDPTAPVRIRPGSEDIYQIGQGRIWRLGKTALAYYLPFRFKRGEPFHAGTPWQAMDLALKGMATVLAR